MANRPTTTRTAATPVAPPNATCVPWSHSRRLLSRPSHDSSLWLTLFDLGVISLSDSSPLSLGEEKKKIIKDHLRAARTIPRRRKDYLRADTTQTTHHPPEKCALLALLRHRPSRPFAHHRAAARRHRVASSCHRHRVVVVVVVVCRRTANGPPAASTSRRERSARGRRKRARVVWRLVGRPSPPPRAATMALLRPRRRISTPTPTPRPTTPRGSRRARRGRSTR